MVEQFEEHVECRLDDMDAKLMAAQSVVQVSQVDDKEQVVVFGKQVSRSCSTL
jgi:hypothetical protein